MRLELKRINLLLLAVVAIFAFTACDSAVFSDSTSENSFLEGSSGTPFLEFNTGEVRDTLSEGRGSISDLLIGPNVSINDTITYEYEVSPGPNATEGVDFADTTATSPRIPIDPDRTSPEEDTVSVFLGGGGLTRSPRLVTVELTSVSTTGGTDIRLGRNGTEIGTSRTIEIDPSIFVRTFAPGPGLSLSANIFGVTFDTTAVGGASLPILNPVLENGSTQPTQVGNFSITGPDADAFVFAGIGGLVRPSPSESVVLGASFPASLELINVQFRPSSPGEKSATLEFDMLNSVDNTTVELSLSGVAVSGN